MTQPENARDVAPSTRPSRPVIAMFTSHWLAMVGLGLVLTAIVLWACLLPVQLRHGEDNPYVGVATIAVGAILLLGVVLAPIGLLLGRRRLARGLLGGQTAWGRLLAFLLVTTALNLVIASQATLRVAHAMESRQFCTSCHVMTPEGRAFEQGAHAGILCVDCHVGEGAIGLVQSKLQGSRQLLSVLRGSVAMPIQGAIEAGHMVPSEQTCEGCHWKAQPAAANLKLIQRYAEDEANTPKTTLLTMNVGGRLMGGIHGAHHGEGVEIRFVATDARRQEIPLVEYHNSATGESRIYVKDGVDAAALESQPRITMQCFDCHNRAAHAFQPPDQAVDRAIMLGRISASLPFVKKKAMEILKASYASSAAAATEIPAALTAAYGSEPPEISREHAAEIAQAGEVLADIYSRNVFPELGVTWGTYPDNRGHQGSPGCFRCHDGEHVDAAGQEITRNCFRCHYPSATDDSNPEVLQILGLDRSLSNLEKK